MAQIKQSIGPKINVMLSNHCLTALSSVKHIINSLMKFGFLIFIQCDRKWLASETHGANNTEFCSREGLRQCCSELTNPCQPRAESHPLECLAF